MKKVIILLMVSSKLFSQTIPAQYKLPVVYIGVPNLNGDIDPNGTGFILNINLDSAGAWMYLITAKHVIIDTITKKPYPLVSVRINLKQGVASAVPLRISTSGPDKNIFFHSDPSVDIAVIPVTISNSDLIDFRTVPESMLFKTRMDFDTSYIREGTNVFYTGMFSPYLGYKKNYPIVRFGRVSLLTDEKIMWDSTKNEISNLFLVETTTYGGNSGSPVFSYGSAYSLSDTTDHHDHSKDSIRLVGIIKGYYGESSPIDFKRTSGMIPTYTSNIGITGVIPSYLLYEILYSDELENARKSFENTSKRYRNKNKK